MFCSRCCILDSEQKCADHAAWISKQADLRLCYSHELNADFPHVNAQLNDRHGLPMDPRLFINFINDFRMKLQILATFKSYLHVHPNI